MPIRVAINGYGRIGRNMLRALYENLQQGCNRHVRLVAINDLGSPESLLHLTRYDTTHGRFNTPVTLVQDDVLQVNGDSIKLLQIEDPAQCPWAALDVDVVLECTGIYRSREDASRHLQAGAKRVIIGAVAFDEVDATIVYGVNHHWLQQQHKVISNASCTTNCIAPVAQIMHENFGIEKAMMTTIHSYTADQNIQDGPHKDLRRARAAAQNIVPTTTGAAIATAEVIPEIKGSFDGMAVRVPTISGSLADFTFLLNKNTTPEKINSILTQASQSKKYINVLEVTNEPIVSTDIIGNPKSSIVDLSLTKVLGGNMAKVVAWYDNEWGYSNRLVDMVEKISK